MQSDKGKSKTDLAEQFGVSLKTLRRWLIQLNDGLQEGQKLDLNRRIFSPQQTRLIEMHLG